MKTEKKYILHGCIWSGIFLSGYMILRIFVLDFFLIPSQSMYPILQAGDQVLVNKLYFGPRLYKNLDFIDTGKEPETIRIKGYSKLQRNDIVVFNFPYQIDEDKIKMNIHSFYIKRCIALPGDSIQIDGGFYVVNGKRGYGNQKSQHVLANLAQLSESRVQECTFLKACNGTIQKTDRIIIPAKGMKIMLTSKNIERYHKQIIYETQENKIHISDTTTYTFTHNWYFMAGDDVLNSYDSRYFGLVPEKYIIGKASLILTAKNPVNRQFHWKRFFTKI